MGEITSIAGGVSHTVVRCLGIDRGELVVLGNAWPLLSFVSVGLVLVCGWTGIGELCWGGNSWLTEIVLMLRVSVRVWGRQVILTAAGSSRGS